MRNGTARSYRSYNLVLPFNFPFFEPKIQLGKREEIRQIKMAWDETLFQWLHTKGDNVVGTFLKEDAKESFFFHEKLYNCHNQKSK